MDLEELKNLLPEPDIEYLLSKEFDFVASKVAVRFT
jgi:hypothetical protein